MSQDRNEYARRWRAKNREAVNRRTAERRRERIAREGTRAESTRALRDRHGRDYPAAFAAMWDEQEGRCYLCGDEITGRAELDHDHSCCQPKRSCRYCRRGLACTRCNRLIGQVRDDPDLLRRIAANLEARASVVRARITAKPMQLELALPVEAGASARILASDQGQQES